MTVPNTVDILDVAPQQVPEFIRSHADARTLSRLVRRLNAELLEGDEADRDLAAAALNHLGLGDQVGP
ncbi:hypothetical protein HKCCSP123_02865 [Rhodobacterales bacterium HKCCSP123]|nr:hypothetical protein [Rhodobacterales bacterium HKCCSP123]